MILILSLCFNINVASPARSHPHREQHHGGWHRSTATVLNLLRLTDHFVNLCCLGSRTTTENTAVDVYTISLIMLPYKFI